jgi:hypothetical protein
MKPLRNAAILIGLAAYLAVFYWTRLPSFPNDAGVPMRRIALLGVLLVRSPEALFSHWFGVPPQFTLSDRLPIVLAAGAILAWAALVGWIAITACRASRGLTRLETAIFSTVVGLNLLSTWMLVLGLFGQLGRIRGVVAPALLTFAAAAGIWYWRKRSNNDRRRLTASGAINILEGDDAREGVQRSPQRRGASPSATGRAADIIGVRWLWLAVPFVVAIFLAAMLPPLDFDVCEYHLQAPKEFFQQGQITFLPHNVYANMPLGAEMLSLLGMVVTGDWWWGALVGKTLIAAFTPLCALALFAAGRRLYSTGVGTVAALAYISIPWIVDVSSVGLVEGVSACYLFLALYAVLLSSESRKVGQPFQQEMHPTALVILAGYLAGGAVATKYPAVLFVVIPLALWILAGRAWQKDRGRDRWSAAREQPQADPRAPIPGAPPPILPPQPRALNPLVALTVFLLAVAIGCGPWLGKNWAFTGNPTYPLLYEVFGGKTWNKDKDRQWNHAHRAQEFSKELLGEHVCRVFVTSDLLSPLVVPLAALAFFGGARIVGRTRLAWALLAYVGFFIGAWWLLTHRIDRFWLPVLPVFALLAGMGAYWNTAVWWRRLLEVFLLAGFAANFLLASAGVANAWFVPLDQLRSEWTSCLHWSVNNSADRGAVLTVGDAAVFDLKPPVFYSTCFDDCVFERLVKGKTDKEIRAEFASRHIAYVLVNWSEIARYRRTYGFTDFVQPEVFDRLVEQGILERVPQSTEPSQRVYRVKL